MNNSHIIKKEQCPRCKERGKDNSKDNLAVYSDGHRFCYSCKYTVFPNGIERFKNKQDEMIIPKEQIYLPVDCDIIYPERALKWVESFELTKNDLYNNNVMWSNSLQRLIFPVYGDGFLIAWQGRSFHLDNQAIAPIPKWFGKGDLKNTFNILGKGNKLVLTEDIISAIKVSKCGVQAMPLYGCTIGRERFTRLYGLLHESIEALVWLDKDKWKESIKEVQLGLLCGINCRSISTELDPKEISYDEIKIILDTSKIS